MFRKIITLAFVLLLSSWCFSKTPATEVRAVWLTTNWNLDFPSPRLSVEGQKDQLKTMLDELRKLNINTIFFQARIRGDVFYNSAIEPRSPFAKKGFDYLEFVIHECHKRNMECHAWLVTFPVGSRKQVAAHGKRSVVNKKRSLCKLYNNEWYLDPGNPDTRDYLLSLVNEIVSNYDIDGIHFDYIRYPDKAKGFPDKDTFGKYGKGQSLDDWRRNNINTLVTRIYDEVKALKPWVQVSSSPIGKYKDLGVSGSTWTAYNSVYQDAALWIKEGKHDALYPMQYFRDGDFYPYLQDWLNHCNSRLIVPGLGIYQMMPSEKDWLLKDITDQIDYIRNNGLRGQAYFRAGNILSNTKGIKDKLKEYYKHPAKLPAMNWLGNVAPDSPVDLEVFRKQNGKLCIKWKPSDNNHSHTYTIYYSDSELVNVNDPEKIIATNIYGNHIELDIRSGDFGFYYSVSASDRFHNESVPCFPAYFVHSEYEK